MASEAQKQIAERLYRVMPGAQMPPIIDGEYAWGEIDATPEWEFCEAIASELTAIRLNHPVTGPGKE